MEERVKKGDCQKSCTLTEGTKKCMTLDFYLILFNFVCFGSKILGHGTTELNLNSQPLWIHLMVESAELADWLVVTNKEIRNSKFCWFEQLLEFRTFKFGK